MKFDRVYQLYDAINNGTMKVDELGKYKIVFHELVNYLVSPLTPVSVIQNYESVIEKSLRLCNDYYVFSSNGDVLITDADFDRLTRIYREVFNKAQVITTDSLNIKTWNERKHVAPNMVGTIEKVFSSEELVEWLGKGLHSITMTPKFDGCSVVLTYEISEEIHLLTALTRKDGVYGQDIKPLIEEMYENDRYPVFKSFNDPTTRGYVDLKCEILTSTDDFEKLKEIKAYKNRRAAASAISANPSNIELAKFLSIEPLVLYDRTEDLPKREIAVRNEYRRDITLHIKSASDPDTIERMDKIIREYKSEVIDKLPYRTDGIVFTLNEVKADFTEDVMSTSIAFKFNLNRNTTKVIGGYLSIGRTGRATPMLKVEPCDLNETEVTDVSLSNFKKVNKLEIKVGDIVQLESAGDVIPMVKKVMETNQYNKPIEFKDECPYCGRKLRIVHKTDELNHTMSDFDLICMNSDCPRVVSGRLANFLDKMGAKEISDGVLLDLYKLMNVKEFPDLFKIERGDLSQYPGWGPVSEDKLISELNRIKTTPFPYSKFMGALGIPMVSTKKCKKIMEHTSFDNLMKLSIRDPEECRGVIMDIKGFSSALASNVTNFLAENYDEVANTAELLTLQEDSRNSNKGNVVMTGFRSEELAEKITDLGFEVSDNVTKETVAVIAANRQTTKAKKALDKGIPIFMSYEENELLSNLKRL